MTGGELDRPPGGPSLRNRVAHLPFGEYSVAQLPRAVVPTTARLFLMGSGVASEVCELLAVRREIPQGLVE
jgi:hypothetical protein